MNENKQIVVKCASCDKFFGYGEDNKNCPFCNNPYGKLIENKNVSEEKNKNSNMSVGKKVIVKSQKDPFKN